LGSVLVMSGAEQVEPTILLGLFAHADLMLRWMARGAACSWSPHVWRPRHARRRRSAAARILCAVGQASRMALPQAALRRSGHFFRQFWQDRPEGEVAHAPCHRRSGGSYREALRAAR